jgi:hypothetical protein
MNKHAILSFTILLLSTAGCSDRQIYEAMQKRGRVECQTLPESQYEDCIKDYQRPYDEYKKDLDEARGKQ